jgi:Tol biopolymer transport system component
MDGTPFLGCDGRRLYFFSDRDAGPGDRDLWFSERASGDARVFGEPKLLRGVNTQSSELLPWLSSDERTLFFVSARSGGRGGADLWRASRDSVDDAFDTPTNIVELSSGQNEGRLVLSSDDRASYFSSNRGGGEPDIWTASRGSTNQAFSDLKKLDQLNSPAPDQDVFLSPDDTELFFASQRGGKSELWRAVRSCE